MKETTILLVEENAVLLQLYRAILIKYGYNVIAVSDGISAIKALQSKYIPAVVITNYRLLDISGLSITRHIRSDRRIQNIPVVMTCTDYTIENEALASGVNAFFAKPISFNNLNNYINKLLYKNA